MKYIKLFENYKSDEEIHLICKKYGIENYTINNGVVDVNGDVNLDDKVLTKIPLNFGVVSGNFWCSNNKLTSLEGCPSHVGGKFYCSYNKLTSLEGCPSHVGGNFWCNNNQLTSLEGCPSQIGDGFYCSYNKLTSLEGCPSEIGGVFWCSNNPVYNIWKLIRRKTGEIASDNKFDSEIIDLFNDYDPIREDGIILDRLNDFLQAIGKEPVGGVKGYEIID
jgi:hypothetical protein